MRLKFETWQEKHDRLRPWHRWFAWHPVDVGNGVWVWLKPVWRSYRASEYYDVVYLYLEDDVALVQWKMENPNAN